MNDLLVHGVSLIPHSEANDVPSRLNGHALVPADLHVPPNALIQLISSEHWVLMVSEVLVGTVVNGVVRVEVLSRVKLGIKDVAIVHEHRILRLVLTTSLQQAQIGEEVDFDLDCLLREEVLELWALALGSIKPVNLPLLYPAIIFSNIFQSPLLL